MRSADLGWVLEQVSARIAVGKIALTRLSRTELRRLAPDDWLGAEVPGGQRRAGHATFVTSEEYTPQERLTILVDALRSATIGAVDVAVEAVRSVTERLGGSEVAFASDAPSADPVVLSLSQLRERKQLADKLGRLLDELSEGQFDAPAARSPR
jgi:hypothetical protein